MIRYVHQVLRNKDANVTVSTSKDIKDIGLVQFAFVAGGIAYCTAGVIFLLAIICTKLTFNCSQKDSVKQEPSTEYSSSSFVLRILKLSMYFILFFNGWLLMTVIQLFSTFVQCGLGWDVNQATRLMTIFYSMFLIGRIISIPLSFFIVAEKIFSRKPSRSNPGYSRSSVGPQWHC